MTKHAKFYTYLNINTKEFSVKFKGKVVARGEYIVFEHPTFRVSEKGRQRVLAEKRKNVHAYVVTEDMPRVLSQAEYNGLARLKYIASRAVPVSYNPYRAPFFGTVKEGRFVRVLTSMLLFGNRGQLFSLVPMMSKKDIVDVDSVPRVA